MKTIFIGLGSNLGDRNAYIKSAINRIKANDFIRVQRVAKIIETDAAGTLPQPKFLNTAMMCETILTPEELLDVTQKIEKDLGRNEKNNKQPRTIDIDILLYGQDIICSDNLTIPHPMMHERSFVLIPLFELAPDVKHPILLEPIAAIYSRIVGY